MTEDELLAQNALLRLYACQAFEMCRRLISALPVTDETKKADALAIADHVISVLEKQDPARVIQ